MAYDGGGWTALSLCALYAAPRPFSKGKQVECARHLLRTGNIPKRQVKSALDWCLDAGLQQLLEKALKDAPPSSSFAAAPRTDPPRVPARSAASAPAAAPAASPRAPAPAAAPAAAPPCDSFPTTATDGLGSSRRSTHYSTSTSFFDLVRESLGENILGFLYILIAYGILLVSLIILLSLERLLIGKLQGRLDQIASFLSADLALVSAILMYVYRDHFGRAAPGPKPEPESERAALEPVLAVPDTPINPTVPRRKLRDLKVLDPTPTGSAGAADHAAPAGAADHAANTPAAKELLDERVNELKSLFEKLWHEPPSTSLETEFIKKMDLLLNDAKVNKFGFDDRKLCIKSTRRALALFTHADKLSSASPTPKSDFGTMVKINIWFDQLRNAGIV